jgi:hemolysin activation/secretion protein|tara:strand:+ start:5241 stop:7274 length:2034 start_codon:yes stop_codon:yes gene_type:complete
MKMLSRLLQLLVQVLALSSIACCSALAQESVPASAYYIVVGSFRSAGQAEQAEADFADLTRLSISVSPTSIGGEDRYRVTVGPFTGYSQAVAEMDALSRKGVASAWIVSATLDAPSPKAPTMTGVVQRSEPARDLAGGRALQRRGIPEDLNRGVRPQITEESMRRYFDSKVTQGEKLLPAPEKRSVNRISQLQEIYLTAVAISGSNLLADEVDALVAPMRDQVTSTEALLNLKNEINQLYVTRGYINTGVVIPDQKIEDGVIRFDLIEGEVTEVNVDSNLRESYISRRLVTSKPFNLQELQSSLKLLEKNPLVERVNARLVPGSEIGQANLQITVDTTELRRFGIIAANSRSPSVGAEFGEVYFQAENLTSLGDSLRLAGSLTQGLNSHLFDFAIPFNSNDHSVSITHSVSDSTVIEEPFDDIEVVSETESISIGLRFPLYRTPNTDVELGIVAEKRRNYTELLDQPFSFSEGAINGESRVTPLRLSLSYVYQGVAQSLATRLVVSKGTSKFDAADNASQPDGDFTSYIAQLQYSRQLSDNFHVTTRLAAQIADDPLLAIERFAIGGLETLRGYRQNQLVRDNIYLFSLEGRYRIPLKTNRLELVSFFDWGSGFNHDDAVSSTTDTLYSVGFGVSLRALRGLRADLFWAHPFDEIIVQQPDLQDDGIHFRLQYEHRF